MPSKTGRLSANARRLLHDEEAVAVDRHEGADRGRLDVALHGVGRARIGDHAAGELLGRLIVGDQIDEARVHPLERGGLRIGDVAGDVFEREGLRPHARDRGGESTEDTHKLQLRSQPARRRCDNGRTFVAAVASPVPRDFRRQINELATAKANRMPGKTRRRRQFLPSGAGAETNVRPARWPLG